MRKELDDALCAKYPLIFADRHKPMQETAMCWGFDCGDGWYDLIDCLCHFIQNRITYNQKEPFQTVATQVKEKFGELCFYVNAADDEIYGAISLAELVSTRICDVCGSPGKRRGEGWIVTRCDAHAEGEE